MAKRIACVALVLMSVGCGPAEPPRPLQVGDRVEKVYMRDLYSGKCVSIDGYGKYQPIYVEPESFCAGGSR